jgi:hypothetical protein
MPKTLSLSVIPLEHALLPYYDTKECPDRLALMLHQEETQYEVTDYLKENEELRKKAAKPVDEDCRVKMCEWCYQVVDFCKFRRETVGIGMSYLDRYLCSGTGKKALGDRKEYQLVAMTCLYVAIKLHEPLEMETSLLADLSRGCYTEMEFANMEQRILLALLWRVNGPTALGFVQQYLLFFPESVHSAVVLAIWDYARYQTEMAISDHTFVVMKPSITGMAALMNAMEGMDDLLLTPKVVSKFVRTVQKYTSMDLDEVIYAQSKLSTLMMTILSEDHKKSMIKALDKAEEEEWAKEAKTASTRSPPLSPIARKPRVPHSQ